MIYRTLFVAFLSGLSPLFASAGLIFELNETASFTHSTGLSDFSLISGTAVSSGSANLVAGTFSWGNLQSDATGVNSAVFGGSTAFIARDWGGVGTYRSNAIDVSRFGSFTFDVDGASNFNTGSEFFRVFYALDSGSDVVVAEGVEDRNESIGFSGSISTSGARELFVGFTFNHNGADDVAEIRSISVTAVPDPSSLAFAAVGGLGMLARYRRRRKSIAAAK